MPINAKELKHMYESLGPHRTCQRITESLQRSRQGEVGHLKPSDFSLRDMAESLVPEGREWVRSMDPRNASSVMESSDAVDSTAFSNVTRELLSSAVMEGYENPAFSMSQMFTEFPTRLSGERVPGVGNIGDKAESVQEGMPFPHVGFGEDFIDTPQTDKKGLIVPITKEAVFFDRTGLILENARSVGEALGINKEKRCVDVAIGVTNNYKWKGTTYNTYQDAVPWINLLAGAEYDLEDWSDVDAAEQLFSEIVDPNTGEPIAVVPNTLIASPAKKHHVNRILNATEVRYTGSGSESQTIASNPITGIRGMTSQWFYSRLRASGLTAAQARSVMLLGDPAKAFRYMQNWGITVVQAPQNSEAEFNQDIVARFKASERGVAVVWNPRYMVRVNGYE